MLCTVFYKAHKRLQTRQIPSRTLHLRLLDGRWLAVFFVGAGERLPIRHGVGGFATKFIHSFKANPKPIFGGVLYEYEDNQGNCPQDKPAACAQGKCRSTMCNAEGNIWWLVIKSRICLVYMAGLFLSCLQIFLVNNTHPNARLRRAHEWGYLAGLPCVYLSDGRKPTTPASSDYAAVQPPLADSRSFCYDHHASSSIGLQINAIANCCPYNAAAPKCPAF